MFKSIICFYALIFLFDNCNIIKAQIYLAKDNLDSSCNCKSSQSFGMNLNNKNISTIDPLTFNAIIY